MFDAKTAKLNETKKQLNQPPNPPSNNENVNPSASYVDLFSDQWFTKTIAAFGDGSSTEPAPMEGDDTNAEDDGQFQGP